MLSPVSVTSNLTSLALTDKGQKADQTTFPIKIQYIPISSPSTHSTPPPYHPLHLLSACVSFTAQIGLKDVYLPLLLLAKGFAIFERTSAPPSCMSSIAPLPPPHPYCLSIYLPSSSFIIFPIACYFQDRPADVHILRHTEWLKSDASSSLSVTVPAGRPVF